MLCFFQLRTFYILLILSTKHDIKAAKVLISGQHDNTLDTKVLISGQHDNTLDQTEYTTSMKNVRGSDDGSSSTGVNIINNDTENGTKFIKLSTTQIKQPIHKNDVSESTMSKTTNKTNTSINLDEYTRTLESVSPDSTLPEFRQFHTKQTGNQRSYDRILSNLITDESLQDNIEIEGNQNVLSTREVKYTTTATEEANQQWNLTTEDECYTYGTCHFVSTKKFKYCNCDEKCHLYNNCCVDAKQNQTEQNLLIECHSFTNDKSVRLGALVISRCPPLSNITEVNFRCLNDDILTGGPFVFGENSMIYRNKFCAACNAVKTFKFFSLEIKANRLPPINDFKKISQKERLSVLLAFGKYLFISDTEDTQLRYCLKIPELKSTENSTYECKNYSFNPVISSSQLEVYRNQFCGPPEFTDNRCFGPELDSNEFTFSNDFISTYPLKVTFYYDNGEENNLCSELTDLTCDTMATETYVGYTAAVNLTLASTAPIDDQIIYQCSLSLVWSLYAQNKIDVVSLVTFTPVYTNVTFGEVIVLYHMSLVIRFKEVLSFQKLMNYNQQLNTFKWSISITDLVSGNSIKVFKYEYNHAKQNMTTPFLQSNFMNENDINAYVKELHTPNALMDNGEYFCDNIEVTGVFNITELLLIHFKCVIDINRSLYWGELQIILTYICTSISIVSLISLIVLNKRLGLTKSVAGSNTENISVSILLSSILVVIGIGTNKYEKVCFFMGIAMQYVWLAGFSFISIAIGYVGYKLRQLVNNVVRDRGEKKTRRLFTCLGLTIPLCLVVPCILLNYFQVPNFAPKYGGISCFPTSFLANLIFFSGPILFSIIFNFLTIVSIIIFVSNQKKNASTLRKTQSYKQVYIYTRLALVTGTLWVMGLLGRIFESEVFKNICVITCSLQGLFIVVANLTTRVVCNKVKVMRSGSKETSQETKLSTKRK